MRQLYKFFLLFLFTPDLLTSAMAQDTFYSRHAEGWFWYKQELGAWNPEPEKQPESDKKPSTSLDAYKKKLEQTLHQALMKPTESNVKAYMTLQKDMMDRANAFSKMWQKVVLTNPPLNHDVAFPTSHYARPVYENQQRALKEQTIQGLSKTFGLFYFFKAHCSYCAAFAPIVKAFSKKYGWDVMAISVDGSLPDMFPNTIQDNGLAHHLQIQSVPALIAYKDQTRELIPLSYAAISLDQLEDNVMSLVEVDREEGKP